MFYRLPRGFKMFSSIWIAAAVFIGLGFLVMVACLGRRGRALFNLHQFDKYKNEEERDGKD